MHLRHHAFIQITCIESIINIEFQYEPTFYSQQYALQRKPLQPVCPRTLICMLRQILPTLVSAV